MTARIYRPSKTAMQSGRAKTDQWVLEFEQEQPRAVEPLMGWTSSGDMKQQLKLKFSTRDEAIAYAEHRGLAYQVEEPQERKRAITSYSENFKYDRKVPWTH